MIQANEVVTLFMGVGALIFIIANFARLREFPEWRLFFAIFLISLCAHFLTVLEGFVWGEVLNSMEHACYGIMPIILIIWFYRITKNEGSL